MDILSSVEVAIVAVALVVVVLLAYLWVRRARIASSGPLMACAMRTQAEPRWRLGLLRFSGDTLEWFSVAGPSTRPEYAWGRHEVDFGAPVAVEGTIPGLPDAVAVSGTAAGGSLDLAMDRGGTTALRAWLESSPPGFNVNVA